MGNLATLEWVSPFSLLSILLCLHLNTSLDSVSHVTLFSLLSVIELTGSALVQILSHKPTSNFVASGKHEPGSVSGAEGVLQSSVFGPLLFYYLYFNPGSFGSASQSRCDSSEASCLCRICFSVLYQVLIKVVWSFNYWPFGRHQYEGHKILSLPHASISMFV